MRRERIEEKEFCGKVCVMCMYGTVVLFHAIDDSDVGLGILQ